MINEDNMYILSKKELKASGAYKFKDGDIVICETYYVNIKFGRFKRASMLTTVNKRYEIKNLPMEKHPQYIRSFIEKLSKEDEFRFSETI